MVKRKQVSDVIRCKKMILQRQRFISLLKPSFAAPPPAPSPAATMLPPGLVLTQPEVSPCLVSSCLPSPVHVQHVHVRGLSRQPVHGNPPNHPRCHISHSHYRRPPAKPPEGFRTRPCHRQPSRPSVVSHARLATATYHVVAPLICSVATVGLLAGPLNI